MVLNGRELVMEQDLRPGRLRGALVWHSEKEERKEPSGEPIQERAPRDRSGLLGTMA